MTERSGEYTIRFQDHSVMILKGFEFSNTKAAAKWILECEVTVNSRPAIAEIVLEAEDGVQIIYP